MLKILFVMPHFNPSFNLTRFQKHEFINKKNFAAPLGLAILAALTPEKYSTRIWDENVSGLVSEFPDIMNEYDLIAVTGSSNHYERQKDISAYFRRIGKTIVVGGPGVSSDPFNYRNHYDAIFIGEGELIWNEFLNDYTSGSFKKEYKETNFINMELSPIPKWDSILENITENYFLGTVQSTRGCPYYCEFCNIWTTYGRQIRTKPIEQVIEEIDNLIKLGFKDILFCNDNFYGKVHYSKDLLRAIIELHKKYEKPPTYKAEISINISKDEEMLELMAAAGFNHLLIGIETPNIDSLKEISKSQNLSGDLVADCMKIMSYGMSIEGSMIVGFDSDTIDIFDAQFDFIQKACIPVVKMHLLKAGPGTALFNRLTEEKRLIGNYNIYGENKGFDLELITNIIPKRMSRQEMFENYSLLLKKIYDWENFFLRLEGFINNINYAPLLNKNSAKEIFLNDFLEKFISSFDNELKSRVEYLIVLTLRRIPVMIYDIVTHILRHQIEVMKLPKLLEDINKIIEYELENGYY